MRVRGGRSRSGHDQRDDLSQPRLPHVSRHTGTHPRNPGIEPTIIEYIETPPNRATLPMQQARRAASEAVNLGPGPSGVLKERHEAEVHVQLLMTMEECQPWIVGDEIERQLLESG
jgi:hypothetical protein